MNLNFFSSAPRHFDEYARQAAVDQLVSRRHPMLERIAKNAADYMDCPSGFVTLIDGDKQQMLAATDPQGGPISRAISFCAHTIVQPGGIMCVPDATKCQRFAGNPLVTGAPHIRFYFGASLVSHGGHRLGAICVIDSEPHTGVTLEQRCAFRKFADAVVMYLES